MYSPDVLLALQYLQGSFTVNILSVSKLFFKKNILLFIALNCFINAHLCTHLQYFELKILTLLGSTLFVM